MKTTTIKVEQLKKEDFIFIINEKELKQEDYDLEITEHNSICLYNFKIKK